MKTKHNPTRRLTDTLANLAEAGRITGLLLMAPFQWIGSRTSKDEFRQDWYASPVASRLVISEPVEREPAQDPGQREVPISQDTYKLASLASNSARVTLQQALSAMSSRGSLKMPTA